MIKLMPLVEQIYLDHLNEDEINELDIKGIAKKLAVGTALGAATMFGSPKANAQIQKHPTTTTSSTNKTLEKKIKEILTQEGISWEASTMYGREGNLINTPKGNIINLYFEKNGNLSILLYPAVGYDGKWKLNGNKLTITSNKLNFSKTFPINTEGGILTIGNSEFQEEGAPSPDPEIISIPSND